MIECYRGVPFDFDGFLRDFNTGRYLSSPTLASGDFKISTDNGAYANLTTLPSVSPAASGQVKFSFSESELDGDVITLKCIDQTSPAEWEDTGLTIVTRKIPTGKVLTNGGSNTATAFKISLFGMGTEATDYLKNAYCSVLDGALKGQVQKISSYDSSIDTLTLSVALTGIPADGVRFLIVNK